MFTSKDFELERRLYNGAFFRNCNINDDIIIYRACCRCPRPRTKAFYFKSTCVAYLLDGSDLMDGLEEVVDGFATFSRPAYAAQGGDDARWSYHTRIVSGEFEFWNKSVRVNFIRNISVSMLFHYYLVPRRRTCLAENQLPERHSEPDWTSLCRRFAERDNRQPVFIPSAANSV